MTTLGVLVTVPNWTDRGLSEEAHALYQSVRWALDFSNTYSIGKPKSDLFAAVEYAAGGARLANWDFEGAAAVEASAIRYALDFASAIPSGLPLPEVYPDQDGDLCFEWYYGPRKVFTACVARDGTMNFAGLFGHSRIHGSRILGDTLSPTVLEGIESATA